MSEAVIRNYFVRINVLPHIDILSFWRNWFKHVYISRFPVSFGLVSGSGSMSLVLPTWSPKTDNPQFKSLVEYFTGRFSDNLYIKLSI